MSYDNEVNFSETATHDASAWGKLNAEPTFPSFAERVEAIRLRNIERNKFVTDPNHLNETDPVKIERQMLKSMVSGRKNSGQRKRRKLIRQNPHLLRGKYKKHSK